MSIVSEKAESVLFYSKYRLTRCKHKCDMSTKGGYTYE